MKIFQVIMKSGLTRNLEAENAVLTDKSIEFQVGGDLTAIFRTETVLRFEAFDDATHHEMVFPVGDVQEMPSPHNAGGRSTLGKHHFDLRN